MAGGDKEKGDLTMTDVLPLQFLARSGPGFPDETPVACPAQLAPQGPLTSRQFDVLALLCEGMPNKRIARELGIAYPTVKVHMSAILRALEVSNRTEAVVRARERGLILRDHDARPHDRTFA